MRSCEEKYTECPAEIAGDANPNSTRLGKGADPNGGRELSGRDQGRKLDDSGRDRGDQAQKGARDTIPVFESVGGGLYKNNTTGAWYERPWVGGRRTWRKLGARTQKEAREELASRRSDQARSTLGLAKNPYAGGQTLGEVLDAYAQAGYPDRHRVSRSGKARAGEERHTGDLNRLIGTVATEHLEAGTLDRYADQRRAELSEGGRDGARTVDREIQTLSNALNYARRCGMIRGNPIQHGRPRYYRISQARHARDCAPASGNELHLLARTLAEESRGEVLAWQLLFSALTGCRTNEILRMRVDAGSRKAGFIEGDWLWIERSKSGVNPFVVLHKDLRECIEGHRRWKASRPELQKSPWYFPSPADPRQPVDLTSLTHALARISDAIGVGDRTAHGLRAYFVTVRRSMGISEGQIAAEIGDKTASLIATTYGQVPPGWRGGPDLVWRPTDGNPAFWEDRK